MLEVKINKELDKEIYKDFYNFSVAGADFAGMIKKDHPDISIENYDEYIENFYKNNLVDLNKEKEIIVTDFNENKDKLREAFIKFFPDASKLEDLNITAYLSIFNCNPRFVKDKSFQIYYKKNFLNKREVYVHETTHFIFFESLEKFLGRKLTEDEINNGKYWELSEIANVLVLNEPKFREILEKEELLFYSSLREQLEMCRPFWSEIKIVNKNFFLICLKSL